jgi:hypothetical protein
MAKRKNQPSVMKQSDLPFEVTAQMRFYFPICDENPYAAFLLDYCYSLRAISLYEYKQKQEEVERRLVNMSPEDREVEVEKMLEDALEKWEDRQLNFYNGEDFFNDEDDAEEGADGIFDLLHLIPRDVTPPTYSPFYREKPPLERIKPHIWEAYHLLKEKGFLVEVALKARLDLWAIEGALKACYPELYERHEQEGNKPEQNRKRESTKVQYHVNSAKRLGLPATLTLPEWMETLSDFHGKCAYCGKAPYAVLEHVQPMIAGGGTTAFNCVPACARCNLLKLDTPPELLPPGFDAALERIQRYLKERKLRYLRDHEHDH